jgi:hypothetical protein
MHLQLLSTWLSLSHQQVQNWVEITPINIHILDVDVIDCKLTSLPQHDCLLILKPSPRNQGFSNTPRQSFHVQRAQRSGRPFPSGHLVQRQEVEIDRYREIRLQSPFRRHSLGKLLVGEEG